VRRVAPLEYRRSRPNDLVRLGALLSRRRNPARDLTAARGRRPFRGRPKDGRRLSGRVRRLAASVVRTAAASLAGSCGRTASAWRLESNLQRGETALCSWGGHARPTTAFRPGHVTKLPTHNVALRGAVGVGEASAAPPPRERARRVSPTSPLVQQYSHSRDHRRNLMLARWMKNRLPITADPPRVQHCAGHLIAEARLAARPSARQARACPKFCV
jgi:hypothetical protein